MPRLMDPIEHAIRTARRDWSGFSFPPAPRLKRGWHPDGDAAWKRKADQLHPDSDKIIAFMKKTGTLNFSSGSTVPDAAGKTGGVFLNTARATDPQYTISKTNGRRNLCVITGWASNYGAKVRIGDHMIVQGYPMNEYSDHKLHIYDPIDQTITEIQFIVDVRKNAVLNWILGLFGQGGGFQCHAARQYSLKVPSTHPSVQGSSAANIPLAETSLTVEDLDEETIHMTTMAVTVPSEDHVWPALASDGESEDPYAPKMGYVLKLSEEAYLRISADPETGAHARTMLRAWHEYGLMVVDTAGFHSIALDPDSRFDSKNIENAVEKVTLDDFKVYTIKPPVS